MSRDGVIADLKHKIQCTQRKLFRIMNRGGQYTFDYQKQSELLEDLQERLAEAESQNQ